MDRRRLQWLTRRFSSIKEYQVSKVDYSNEVDYYEQGFEEEGIVSVWLGIEPLTNDEETDVLQELCGVGYYDISSQEGECFDFQDTDITSLIHNMSYSNSFIDLVVEAAKRKNINSAKWVTLQYDFNYNPEKVNRTISPDPLFIGAFPYKED
nr:MULTISPECIES: immunity 22 family protein [unclassified Pseudoalteromonas]